MVYGTVCSGVEAFGPAWEAMGYACAFHAETAAHPAAVLRYRCPDTPNYGDFTQIRSERVDLLAGGTPCQDFSAAGLRRGLAGLRGQLTLEFAWLLERLGCPWMVWENVPGVLSADGGRAFGRFLALLAELGYHAAYRVLDAQHFGVPQRRRRVFVVGYLGDWRPAAAVLFERESLLGHPAPSREARQDLAGTLTATTGGSGPAGRLELAISGYLQTTGTLAAGYSKNGSPDVDAGLYVGQCHGSRVGQMGTLRAGQNVTAGVPFTTGTLCASGKAAGSATQQDAESDLLLPIRYAGSHQDVIFREEGIMNCLQAGTNNNGGSYTKTLIGNAVRRLTPLECERLMGYPDEWTKYGTYPNGATKQIADGPRYQMCGNGWATPVANWIGQRIMLVNKLLQATL